MARLCRLGFQILQQNVPITYSQRLLSVSAVNKVKEIRESRNGAEIVVEGVFVESPRQQLLIKAPESIVEGNKQCYMCALDLDLKHTDVLILSQFVRSDGCMLPRRITGLCRMQQKKVGTLVSMAHKAGLMINMTPSNCKRDPTKRHQWKKFNTYYDEKTIFNYKEPRQSDKYKH